MSTISMMELNAKSPFIWDRENLVMPNNNNTTKVGETPRKLQLVDSDIDGIEGFEVGSFYSSGGRSDNGTGSDLGYASSSKSSKSASIDSCPERGMKGNNNFILETTRTSSNTIESSAASGESLIALELGKRTFFEDVFAASNTNKTSGLNSIPPNSPAKKSKPASISTEIPRCQVEGCNLDLSSAKDYHRKHRVCEDHSKSPKVVINGLERRFCQQCSRFHSLSEFDQKKRSCRRRLSDHNARRRKPKPEVIQFNSMRMAPSLYEGRNQLNFGFNQVSVIQASQGGWCNSTNSKDPASAKQNLFTIMKSGSADELHSSQTGLQASEAAKLSSLPAQLLPSKGSPSELFQHGLAVSMAESELDGAQDIRALSLLSTTSWGSSSPFEHSIHRNGNGNGNGNGNQHPSLAHPVLPIDTLPISNPSPYWQAQAQQPPPVSPAQGSHLSTFQLFKSPTESTFYLY